jgi:hypothetical protein
MPQKLFTIDEARALLPHLSQLFRQAHSELEQCLLSLETANESLEEAELLVDNMSKHLAHKDDVTALRQSRSTYETAINQLSTKQKEYVEKVHYFLERISETGVIVRDFKEGLCDFPAQKGDTDYLLCWHLGEPDIGFWHLDGDGFVGRKPLATLAEYY